MNYAKLKDTWVGIEIPYTIASKKILGKKIQNYTQEDYTPRITLSYPQWQRYISAGNNVLLGSGGVIPGGTVNTGWGGGAVYKGHVRQGW